MSLDDFKRDDIAHTPEVWSTTPDQKDFEDQIKNFDKVISLEGLEQQLNTGQIEQKTLRLIDNYVDTLDTSEKRDSVKQLLEKKLEDDGAVLSLKSQEGIRKLIASIDKDNDKVAKKLEKQELKQQKKQEKNKEQEKKDQTDTSKEQESTLTDLEKEISKLDEKYLNNLTEILQWIQTGKVSVGQLDSLHEGTKILQLLLKSDKKAILEMFDNLTTKNTTLDNNKIKEIKTAFQAILNNPHFLNKFVSLLDKDLNGISYEDIMKPWQNLDTPEAKKSINTIFYRDEKLFNQLVNDFESNDEQKKQSVEAIVKKYISLQAPSLDLQNTTLKVNEIDINGQKKQSFSLIDSKGQQVVLDAPDKDWKTKEITIAPYFGALEKWTALTLQQCVDQNPWFKKVVWVDKDGMINLDPSLNRNFKDLKIQWWGEKKGWFDSLKSIFDSSLFDELKQIFLMLSWLKNGMSENDAVESDFISSKKEFRQFIRTDKFTNLAKELAIDTSPSVVWNKFVNYRRQKTPDTGKKMNTDNHLGSEKAYFNLLSTENQIRYLYGKEMKDNKGNPIKERSADRKPDTKQQKPWTNNSAESAEQSKENPNIIKVKGLDPQDPDKERDMPIPPILSEWGKEYMWFKEIKNNTITFYEVIKDGSWKMKTVILKNATLQRDWSWKIISGNIEPVKKEIDMSIKIPEWLSDNDKFDFWKVQKMSLVYDLIKIHGGSTNEEFLTKILIKNIQKIDQLQQNQRTKENLQNILYNTKNEIFNLIPKDRRDIRGWKTLDTLELI